MSYSSYGSYTQGQPSLRSYAGGGRMQQIKGSPPDGRYAGYSSYAGSFSSEENARSAIRPSRYPSVHLSPTDGYRDGP